MSALSNLWSKLSRSKRYRESFAASVAKRLIPLQISVLRRQHDWSQARLAKESGLTQGVISRAEDPEYGNLTVNTLVRVAAGFDCAFIGRFVPFSELSRWYANLDDENSLRVASFLEEQGSREGSYSEAITLPHPEKDRVIIIDEGRKPPRREEFLEFPRNPYGIIREKA
jgi:transcriptional regulator with XRE-family HTH domain